jgi:hypothetical protein
MPGLLAGFNGAAPYVWKFAGSIGANAGISDFEATDFLIDTSGFQNAFTGLFSVVQSGHDLTLNYTPVPEPQTSVMVLLGLAGFAVWRNRAVITGRAFRD